MRLWRQRWPNEFKNWPITLCNFSKKFYELKNDHFVIFLKQINNDSSDVISIRNHLWISTLSRLDISKDSTILKNWKKCFFIKTSELIWHLYSPLIITLFLNIYRCISCNKNVNLKSMFGWFNIIIINEQFRLTKRTDGYHGVFWSSFSNCRFHRSNCRLQRSKCRLQTSFSSSPNCKMLNTLKNKNKITRSILLYI